MSLPLIASRDGQAAMLRALGASMGELPRVAITGAPRTGKTTATLELAQTAMFSGARVRHTDDVMDQGWSEASEEVADWFDYTGGLLVEGVAVPRGLRKWLRRGHQGRPVHAVVVLTDPFQPLSEGQTRMAVGLTTVLGEIRAELEKRGVLFVTVR